MRTDMDDPSNGYSGAGDKSWEIKSEKLT